jgi:hypothetical protein
MLNWKDADLTVEYALPPVAGMLQKFDLVAGLETQIARLLRSKIVQSGHHRSASDIRERLSRWSIVVDLWSQNEFLSIISRTNIIDVDKASFSNQNEHRPVDIDSTIDSIAHLCARDMTTPASSLVAVHKRCRERRPAR